MKGDIGVRFASANISFPTCINLDTDIFKQYNCFINCFSVKMLVLFL